MYSDISGGDTESLDTAQRWIHPNDDAAHGDELEALSAVEGDVNPRSLLEEEFDSVEYFDPAKIHHTLGERITDWDERRAAVLNSADNTEGSNQSHGKRRILMVSGSQPKPCDNPKGECFILKNFKNKVDYCRLQNIDIFYNMASAGHEDVRVLVQVASSTRSDAFSPGEVKRRITERAAAKEVLVMMKREMESCVRVMEKEKLDLQDGFDKELERRENDWYAKFEKSRSEENWLRERVRRLEEEKGSMQSELEAVASKENNLREKVRKFEQQMDGHRKRVEGAEKTILDLRQSLANNIQQTRQAENEVEMVKKAYLETERESQKLSEVQGSSILRKSLARAHRDGRKDTGERLVRTKSVSSADGDSSRRMTPEQAGADDVAQNSGLSVQDALVVANSSNIVGFTAAYNTFLDGRYDLLERSGAA
ncbi:hypothetical protein R1sor_016765 [Riccia sorocarpa]|uniref:Uncharacterized protein n=1 Tax=Riccia sorocarpa TaxID=122646 RepID=A0ABD3HHY5_9MARC